MPYPEDPFALTLRMSFKCPSCTQRALVRSTKDQQSPFMGQVTCSKCGYSADIVTLRKSVAASLKKAPAQ